MALEVEHAGFPQLRPPGEGLELDGQLAAGARSVRGADRGGAEGKSQSSTAAMPGTALSFSASAVGLHGERQAVVAGELRFDRGGAAREIERIGDDVGRDVLQVCSAVTGYGRVVEVELPQERGIGLKRRRAWRRPGRLCRESAGRAVCRTDRVCRRSTAPAARTSICLRSPLGTSSTTTSSPSCRAISANTQARCSAVPWPKTSVSQGRYGDCLVVGVELDVADDPIEQRRRPGDVVEAVALRPAADVAEPNRFLQQPAFVRLDCRVGERLGRDQRREPIVVGQFADRASPRADRPTI